MDECSETPDACGVGERCINEQGRYSCECESGYVKKDERCVKEIKKGMRLICTEKLTI